jgi:hypothetical protein
MPDNVSDRERVEKALRRSEERFELFMRHLPGAAFIKDSAGRYVYANLAARRRNASALAAGKARPMTICSVPIRPRSSRPPTAGVRDRQSP